MAKQPTITAVLVAPGEAPKLIRIPNELRAFQKAVGGLIEVFPVEIPGAVGICNDSGLIDGLPLCRYNKGTRGLIAGHFLVVGDAPPEFESLSLEQQHAAFEQFGDTLTLGQIALALKQADARAAEFWEDD